MGIDLNGVDNRVIVDVGVDLELLGVSALLEEFLVLEFLDFFLGEGVALGEGDFAINGNEVLSEDSAD